MTRAANKRPPAAPPVSDRRRVRLTLEGLLQGVGLRPHVSRLAQDLDLNGWVVNSGNGVTAEIEGDGTPVGVFLDRLKPELPPLARLDRVHSEELPPYGYSRFEIRPSVSDDGRTALVLPDIATCDECLKEIADPADRRYQYPFTNCTHCGPRFSILEALPYDRANTTMRHFTMCATCRAEYATPTDRRFHAQPIACPDCGPKLALLERDGSMLADGHQALLAAAAALRDGQIVALKGLGGFQLLADARNDDALRHLRERKNRPDKPFAIMAPSAADTEAYCRLSDLERDLLTSPQAPIVLLSRRALPVADHPPLSASIAPGNPSLGVMLPYTPLHHLLMRELGFPIVATSGNISGEPMVTDEQEALVRLGAVADLFLVHDRPVAAAMDDSVVRVMAGRPLVLRRARGYAPLPVPLPRPAPALLALGGHLKSAAAASFGAQVIVGPHIGDLQTARSREAFHGSLDHLRSLHDAVPAAIACDRHPDYYTSRVAGNYGTKVIPVQHHIAHIAACMAEHGIEGPVLGVAWDGTGYGTDGTLWGGEFIVVDGVSAHRAGHLLPFPLPGGDSAAREPRRAAIGLLSALGERDIFSDETLKPVQDFTPAERGVLVQMLAKNVNCPRTSSMGRLFDAVAALSGLTQKTSFEGQAAMALEFALGEHPAGDRYPLPLDPANDDGSNMFTLDWRQMIRALLTDLRQGVEPSRIAAAFHNSLIDAIVSAATRVGQEQVVLTGGCFQNRYLTEGAVNRLRSAGFTPYWHRDIPPNDGGLALGQAAWAARLLDAGAA